jgi:hypothetical protein
MAPIPIGKPYLSLHDSLLETRSSHGLLARLLASRPSGSAVRGLDTADLLADGGVLTEIVGPHLDQVGDGHRVSLGGVGSGDIGLRSWRRGVIGLHTVLVQTGDGGGVGASGEARGRGGQRCEAATAGHHAGGLGPEDGVERE